MKYLTIKNINLIKEKLLKFYLIQVVMVVLALAIDHNVLPMLEIEYSYNYLGLNKLEVSGIIEVLIKLISFLIIIYTTMKIYLREIDSNTEYTALRLNKYKWAIYNMISCICFTIFMRIVIIFITYFDFYITNHSFGISFLLNVLCKDLTYYIIISMLSMIILNFVSKNMIGKLIGIFFLILLMFSLRIDIINVNTIILIAVLLLTIIVNIISFNPIKVSNMFKRS